MTVWAAVTHGYGVFSEGNAVERRPLRCSARWLGGSGFAAREACGSGFHRARVEPDAAAERSKAGSGRCHRRACGPRYGTDGSGPVRRRSGRGRRRGTPQIEQRPHDHQCQVSGITPTCTTLNYIKKTSDLSLLCLSGAILTTFNIL